MLKIENITILLNGSPINANALQHAVNFAKDHGAHIHFLKVVESCPRITMMFNSSTASIKKSLHTSLEAEVKKFAAITNDIPYSCNLREGTIFVETIREISRTKSSLLIIPEPDTRPTYFDNTYHHLARKCPAPVWFVKKNFLHDPIRTLVVIDLDFNEETIRNNNAKCMDIARMLAKSHGAIIDVTHTWSLPNEDHLREIASNITISQIKEMTAREHHYHEEWFYSFVLKQQGMKLNSVDLLNGDKGTIVSELVKKNAIDLLIMATVNDIATPGVLISNEAESILQEVDCSVMAIKPDGFTSPVT